MTRRMGPVEWAMLVALSILWGSSFLSMAVALPALPPLTVVTLRVGFAALALWAVVLATRTPMRRDRAAWLAFAGMGILNNVIPFLLIGWAQTHLPSGVASIFNAMTPIFTLIVAHVMTTDEKFTPARVAGVVLGFAGVAVMMGGGAMAALGIDIVAEGAILLGTLSYAFSSLYGRRFSRMGLTPLATATGQITSSTVILLPLALLIDQPWLLPPPGLAPMLAVLWIAVPSTAVAYILFFSILARAGATNLMLVTFLIPATAILLGAVVLGERLEPRFFAGLACIAAGLAIIDGRIVARLRTTVSSA